MPLLNESSVGATSVTSPTLSLVDNSFTYTSAKNTDMLFVDQLPKLVFYIVQTVGANPITVTPQFALRSTTGISEPQLIWLQLSAPFVMPALNTPCPPPPGPHRHLRFPMTIFPRAVFVRHPCGRQYFPRSHPDPGRPERCRQVRQ